MVSCNWQPVTGKWWCRNCCSWIWRSIVVKRWWKGVLLRFCTRKWNGCWRTGCRWFYSRIDGGIRLIYNVTVAVPSWNVNIAMWVWLIIATGTRWIVIIAGACGLFRPCVRSVDRDITWIVLRERNGSRKTWNSISRRSGLPEWTWMWWVIRQSSGL